MLLWKATVQVPYKCISTAQTLIRSCCYQKAEVSTRACLKNINEVQLLQHPPCHKRAQQRSTSPHAALVMALSTLLQPLADIH
jgi:hypothetical protein